ncbi:hypothetical protein AVT69_gp323 [Pseudomonas phage PhiPA3]|uniref:Uncharacterized protein 325 n=1 Tax=Pseudomonas phage PhiPA3 TaxID=998086 RepID=F8SJG1_BPPA3|nr:hypothetical protein AVT69_gp323 [Pseudomonas phage PhiPA3]AEH03748.1 hypothetical protein [Pseudomonas phage PhiPA3]
MEEDKLILLFNFLIIGGAYFAFWLVMTYISKPVLEFHVRAVYLQRLRVRCTELRGGFKLRRGNNGFYVIIGLDNNVRYQLPGNSFRIAQQNPDNIIFQVQAFVKKGRVIKYDYIQISKHNASLDWESLPIGNPMQAVSA